MSADEKPEDRAVSFETKRTMIVIDAHGPELAHFLEMQRRVQVVLQPKMVLLLRSSLRCGRQPVEMLPELRRYGGIH